MRSTNMVQIYAVGLALLLSSFAQAQTFDTPEDAFGGAENAPYLAWVGAHGAAYPRSLFLASGTDPASGIALHWRMDDDEQLHIAVAAKAQGWVGFGLSENGGMRGADIVYFESSKPDEVTDAYVVSNRFPLVDDCQDWNLTQSFTDDGFLIFEASRAIDTGDKQDHPLIFDAPESSVQSRIVAAWGDTPEISTHGAANRARGQLRWFQSSLAEVSSFQDVMREQADGFFEHRAGDYALSTEETQYVGFCIGRDVLIAQGVPMESDPLYLIGFEPIVDPRSAEFVHHFIVTASGGYADGTFADCERLMGDGGITTIYGWAPGESPFALPNFLGLPFGDAEGLTGLHMSIHYDNPNGNENVLDNSGVRYYYTTKPREHELGTFPFGDPAVLARGKAVGEGLSQHLFECPGDCSSSLDEPVTVIRQYIHMHKTGTAARSEQIRDGKVIRKGMVDVFDFDQQVREGTVTELKGAASGSSPYVA